MTFKNHALQLELENITGAIYDRYKKREEGVNNDDGMEENELAEALINNVLTEDDISINDTIKDTEEIIVNMEEASDIENKIAIQVIENEDMITNDDNKITSDTIQLSQETFFNALGRLGVDKNVISYCSVSAEANISNIERLVISTENLKEILKDIVEYVKELLKKAIYQIRKILTKFGLLIGSKKNYMITLGTICKKYKDINLVPLSNDVIRFLNNRFYILINSIGNKFDVELFIDYITKADVNVFTSSFSRLSGLLKQNGEHARSEYDKIIEDIYKETVRLPMQKEIMNNIKPYVDPDRNLLYIVSVKGLKCSYVSYNTYKNINKDNVLFKVDSTYINPKKQIKDITFKNKLNKMGDVEHDIYKVVNFIDNASSYINRIDSVMNRALKEVTYLDRELDRDNLNKLPAEEQRYKQMVTENILRILRSVGAKIITDQISQYLYTINNLCKLYTLIVNENIPKKVR